METVNDAGIVVKAINHQKGVVGILFRNDATRLGKWIKSDKGAIRKTTCAKTSQSSRGIDVAVA